MDISSNFSNPGLREENACFGLKRPSPGGLFSFIPPGFFVQVF